MKTLKILLLTILTLIPTLALADSSERIRQEIFDRIKRERDFGAYNIEIDARRGVVTLTGRVASQNARARLNELAELSAGVESVRNEVLVEGAPSPLLISNNTAAGSVAEKIVSRARAAMVKENYNLQVSQSGNEIILNGTVATTDGAARIRRIATEVAPGSVIRDRMVVTEEVVTDEQIRARVLNALKQEPLIKTDDLNINVNNGIVEIGAVRNNHREIDRILSVVVMVDGVKDVKSTFRLSPS